MKGYYSWDLTVLPGSCDSAAKLGVPDTFALFMDAATLAKSISLPSLSTKRMLITCVQDVTVSSMIATSARETMRPKFLFIEKTPFKTIRRESAF